MAKQLSQEITSSHEVTNLDELLTLVALFSGDESARIAEESLRQAHHHLAANMCLEYVQDLELARHAAASISSAPLRDTVDRSIAKLMEVAKTS